MITVLLAIVLLSAGGQRFMRVCEGENMQGTRTACLCLLARFERRHANPDPLAYLTSGVPYWYSDRTGRCGVG